jgi:hypothetical protein
MTGTAATSTQDTATDVSGTLIVTNADLLIRPRVNDHSLVRAEHDVDHAFRILERGNYDGMYMWHIFTSDDADTARHKLDPVFRAYIDRCMLGGQFCDAHVMYAVDGNTIFSKGYGFEEPLFSMLFMIHCELPDTYVERDVTRIMDEASSRQNWIVVRPAESELGYAVTVYSNLPDEDDGIEVDDSDDDMGRGDEPDESDDDEGECPLCGARNCNTFDCQQ